MNEINDSKIAEGFFRLVYLQPNPYSDEALVVGVAAEFGGSLYFNKINAPENFDALSCFFGKEAREQVIFALDVMRELIQRHETSLPDFESPTTSLKLGSLTRASCEDPEVFLRDLLKLASSLYRSYSIGADCNFESVNQKSITTSLKKTIVRLNPFWGKDLIKPARIQWNDSRYFEIPISGSRTIGMPISLVSKEPSAGYGETIIAKLSYAREQLKKDPIVYVYMPQMTGSIEQTKVEDSLGELQLVGHACDVKICADDSIENLARAVYRNEQLSIV